MRDPRQTVANLIDKQNVSFIASVDENGFPCMKAMLPPRRREGIRRFWFTSNTSSMRATQYRQNHKASIYFCDRRFFRGVMLLGTMEVLEDAPSKELIWQEGDALYYPKGVTDPDYCVLCFTAASAKANPYALSGNRIVELRPAAATDRVVGSLPATISQFISISSASNILQPSNRSISSASSIFLRFSISSGSASAMQAVARVPDSDKVETMIMQALKQLAK